MKKILFLLIGLMTFGFTMAQSKITRDTYVYAIKGTDTLHLDLYVDHSVQVKGKRPVMIYIHGGGFSTGSRKNVAQEIYNRHLAEKGFLSVSIDYRLALGQDLSLPNGNKYKIKGTEDAVRIANEDVVSATNYILSKANEWQADSSTILISGGSAGAISALSLEYDICNGADYTKALPQGFNYAGVVSQAGAIPSKNDTLVWKQKPCPVWFIHGSKDTTVPFERGVIAGDTWFGTKYLSPQFDAMKVPHWTYVEKGADHVMAMKALTDNLEEMDKFYRCFIVNKCKTSAYTEWADEVPADMTSIDQMIKYVPLYIIGFGKYMEELGTQSFEKPKGVIY